MPTKPQLRQTIRQRLQSQAPAARDSKSRLIAEKLFAEPGFQNADTVLFYVATPQEVDTAFMIARALEQGKKILAPLSRVETMELELYQIQGLEGLKKSAYGIWEPVPGVHAPAAAESVRCVVVPGVAFDKKNYRLGNGKGFYDRFLKKIQPGVPKLGLGFSFQIVERIPVEPWDVPVDKVLTEE